MINKQVKVNLKDLDNCIVSTENGKNNFINFIGNDYVSFYDGMHKLFYYNNNGNIFHISNVDYNDYDCNHDEHTATLNLEGSGIDMQCNNEPCESFSDSNIAIDILSLF